MAVVNRILIFEIKHIQWYLVILAFPFDSLLIADDSLNMSVLLLYILERHVPECHLHDFSYDPGLIALLVTEVEQTYLIVYLTARFQDELSAILVSEGQKVWLGEGWNRHALLRPVTINGGELDLLKQRELREIQGRVSQGAIDHSPRFLQVEGLEDLREEMQGTTCKVRQYVCWRARCVPLVESFKLIKYPGNGEIIDVMTRLLPVFGWSLPVTAESSINDCGVSCVDDLR